jgi:hypothetical protein
MVANGLWKVRHYDYLQVVPAMKDSMHAQEHCTCDKMLEGTVAVVGNSQHAIGITIEQSILIKRLLKRVHLLCNSLRTQWVSLLRFSNQKVRVALWQITRKRKEELALRIVIIQYVMQMMS